MAQQQALFEHGASDADRYATWVRVPDARGRMGFEAPRLPARVRWWAIADFDDWPRELPGERIAAAAATARRAISQEMPAGARGK